MFFSGFFCGFYLLSTAANFLIEISPFFTRFFALAKNLLASKTSIKTGILFLVKWTTTLPISLAKSIGLLVISHIKTSASGSYEIFTLFLFFILFSSAGIECNYFYNPELFFVYYPQNTVSVNLSLSN